MLGRSSGDPSSTMSRRLDTVGLMTWMALFVCPALAHAHGAMSGDELGPPLMTSAFLGIVSYWVVMLWPSSRKNHTSRSGSNRQSEQSPGARKPKRTAGAKSLVSSRRVGPTRVVRRQAGEEESSNG